MNILIDVKSCIFNFFCKLFLIQDKDKPSRIGIFTKMHEDYNAMFAFMG